jgi:5-hydroxyisourate hydrolase-like protein (transthyretin family)
MGSMLHRSFVRFAVSVAVLSLSLALLPVAAQTSGRGRKYQAPPPSATIRVTVLRDTDGKPLENVAVIFHPIEGDRDKGGMELKTNEDGKAVIEVIPIGDTVRMQVFATGYQTYGEDYKVDKAEISKEVRMRRPGKQYSTYEHANSAGDQKSGSGEGQSPAPGNTDKQPSK